jgi:hypothetical protein
MTSQQAIRQLVRRRALTQMAVGVGVTSIPIGLWWYRAAQERKAVVEEVQTRVRIPNVETSDDRLLSKCRAGDVIVFDRRCEKCAAGPWAALACILQKRCLTGIDSVRSVDHGAFDHIGIVVPGYIKSKHDAFDESNLHLLEVTPSGILSRDLRTRLEMTQSRSVLLLQLCSPGENRDVDPEQDDDSQQTEVVVRTRRYVEGQLSKFRDKWTQLGAEKGYHWMHSTLCIGGALIYQLGLHDLVEGPVSPAAYLVLMGLQDAAAAQNINARRHRAIKVEDYLRDYRFDDVNAVRLRPGWRFLAPIPLRETAR